MMLGLVVCHAAIGANGGWRPPCWDWWCSVLRLELVEDVMLRLELLKAAMLRLELQNIVMLGLELQNATML